MKRGSQKVSRKSSDYLDDPSTDHFSNLLSQLEPAKKLLKGLLEKQDRENISTDECDVNNVVNRTLDHQEVLESENIGAEASDEDEEEESSVIHDPFSCHFEKDLPEDIVDRMKDLGKMEKTKSSITNDFSKENFEYAIDKNVLGDHLFSCVDQPDKILSSTLRNNLQENWKICNKTKSKSNLSLLQKALYEVVSSYQDLFFADRNFTNGEEIRRLYTLHAVNHVLKSSNRITKNNAKLAKAAEKGVEIAELRDQGITRPKVLIVVPFKDSCLKIVNCMISLCFGNDKKAMIMQKKRFKTEFSSEQNDQKSFRPDDFKSMFQGNIDDCFRIGIALSKKSMKLYAPFYSADIIIASPLGLRTIIGSQNEKQDYDFLSSIELLILDQSDVFMMQNWEHVLTVLDHLHVTPKTSHDADFSRLRMWNANEWSKYYRQTILFSSMQLPQINNIFNRYCFNFAGKVKVTRPEIQGSIQQVVREIPQVFHRVPVESYGELADCRFEYFTERILPDVTSRSQDSIAIFVPSYFDFVRLRNYFKKEELSFVQISEYSKKSYISHARTLFNEKRKQFLIFTGRFFFYYRHRITGIKHLVFYELPQYPQSYAELVNFIGIEKNTMQSSQNVSCVALYSRYDATKLEGVVGTDRFKSMTTSKAIHMLVTGNPL